MQPCCRVTIGKKTHKEQHGEVPQTRTKWGFQVMNILILLLLSYTRETQKKQVIPLNFSQQKTGMKRFHTGLAQAI
jgi:hypothetical protein